MTMKSNTIHNVDEIALCLQHGDVVLLPTDTVYGLAVMPEFDHAVDRVYAMKRRPRAAPLPIMVASEDDLAQLGVDLTPACISFLRSGLMPGALTLVMGFKDRPTPDWLSGRDEVAIRIPDDERLLAVLRQTGPLYVTSANTHGVSTPESMADILLQLNGAPDMALDGGDRSTVPSTVINCRCQPPKIERKGLTPLSDLEQFLK
jgi:L-threonylcarbamoyladenylate synthase